VHVEGHDQGIEKNRPHGAVHEFSDSAAVLMTVGPHRAGEQQKKRGVGVRNHDPLVPRKETGRQKR